MGIEEIRRRTAERKAAGTSGVYPQHAGRAAARAKASGAVAKSRVALPVCAHEGRILSPCHSCGAANRHVRACEFEGGEKHGRCVRDAAEKADPGEVTNCATCPDHTARARILSAEPPRPTFTPQVTDPAAGVVIGSYGWPALVALQIRVIRETCGPVPICVSSDKPEATAELAAICSAAPDVYLWPNATRIGHCGGDISAYWKGIVWGAARGLKVVAKLSHRFFALRPRWLQDGAGELLASGLPLATRKCAGRENFPLRTEAVLLDVAQWNRPDVLAMLAPREYWRDVPGGNYVEHYFDRLLRTHLGGVYWPWSLLNEDRYAPAPDTLWHCSHTRAEYDALAARYGVTLPPDFHVEGWMRDLKAGIYKYG